MWSSYRSPAPVAPAHYTEEEIGKVVKKSEGCFILRMTETLTYEALDFGKENASYLETVRTSETGLEPSIDCRGKVGKGFLVHSYRSSRLSEEKRKQFIERIEASLNKSPKPRCC
jgi:hypothetical protein